MSGRVRSIACTFFAFAAAVSESFADEASIIQACSQMTADALRTISVQSSSSTSMSWFNTEYCSESRTYQNLSTESKAKANILVPEILDAGGGSNNRRNSVEEAYDAFCLSAEKFDGVDQNYFKQLIDLSAEANRTAQFCLESARLGVEARFKRPAAPGDLTFFTLRGRDGAKRYIKGVYTTDGTSCSVDGRPVQQFYGAGENEGIPFDASTVTVICKRSSRPIELFGVPADYYPRSQITVITSYAVEPFQIVVPEAAAAPMSDRIAQLEGQISALKTETELRLDTQREELLNASRRAFNDLNSQYRYGSVTIPKSSDKAVSVTIPFKPAFDSPPRVFAMRRNGSTDDAHTFHVRDVTASGAKIWACRPQNGACRDYTAPFVVDWFAVLEKNVQFPQ